jgi:hypothetical protein
MEEEKKTREKGKWHQILVILCKIIREKKT